MVKIELYDVVGKLTKNVFSAALMDENEHKPEVFVHDLKPGVYFIRTKINDSESVTKLLITD